jgi:HAD superfamily hydrolase (TIGR01490 family)
MKQRHIAAFDFDGTITRRDTLIEFIRFSQGNIRFALGFLLYSPWLVAYKLRLYPNWQAKQKIFTHFFGGMPYAEFQQTCLRFFLQRGDALVYEEARQCIRRHLAQGDEVVMISASVEDWVRPFAESLGVQQVLATRVEVSDRGALTGRFLGRNCYGAEKVARLRTLYPDRAAYTLTAYGDSRGDRELLADADQAYYQLFHH